MRLASTCALLLFAPDLARAQNVSLDLAAGLSVPFGLPESPSPAPGFHATLGLGGRPGRSNAAVYFVVSAARTDYATERQLFESRGAFRLSRAMTDLTAGVRALIPIVPFVPRLRLELELRGGLSFLESSLRELETATVHDSERAFTLIAAVGIQLRASRLLSISLRHVVTGYLSRDSIDFVAELAGYTTAPSRGQNTTMASLVFHF